MLVHQRVLQVGESQKVEFFPRPRRRMEGGSLSGRVGIGAAAEAALESQLLPLEFAAKSPWKTHTRWCPLDS